MYGLPITPSKSRFLSKTYLVNLAVGALSVAELKLGMLQPMLPVNFFLLVSFLLPVVNFILRENTDRAVGLDAPGVSASNRLATVVLALFALALLIGLLVWPPAAKAVDFSLLETRYCGPPARDWAGEVQRRPAVRAAFVRQHPCPATGATRGGCDAVFNMQWLPESLKVVKGGKDGFERRIYGGQVYNTPACTAPSPAP